MEGMQDGNAGEGGPAVGMDALGSILSQVFSGMLGGGSSADLSAQRRERRRRHLQSLQVHDGNSLTVLQSYLSRVRNIDSLGEPRGMMPAQSYRMGNGRVQLSEITRASLKVIDDYTERHDTDLIAELGRLAGEALPEATSDKLVKLIERARKAAKRAEDAIAQALAQLDQPSSTQGNDSAPRNDAGCSEAARAAAGEAAAADQATLGQGQDASNAAGTDQPDGAAASAAGQHPTAQGVQDDAVMDTVEADHVVGEAPPAAQAAAGEDNVGAPDAGTQDMAGARDEQRGSGSGRRASRRSLLTSADIRCASECDTGTCFVGGCMR